MSRNCLKISQRERYNMQQNKFKSFLDQTKGGRSKKLLKSSRRFSETSMKGKEIKLQGKFSKFIGNIKTKSNRKLFNLQQQESIHSNPKIQKKKNSKWFLLFIHNNILTYSNSILIFNKCCHPKMKLLLLQKQILKTFNLNLRLQTNFKLLLNKCKA